MTRTLLKDCRLEHRWTLYLMFQSPESLFWSCDSGTKLSDAEWISIRDHLSGKLSEFLGVNLVFGEAEEDTGFTWPGTKAVFSYSQPGLPLLGLELRGEFDAYLLGGEQPYVQCWIVLYSQGKRLGTVSDEGDFIFLRYVRSDAPDDDWDKPDCSGEGEWRSCGWGSHPPDYHRFNEHRDAEQASKWQGQDHPLP